MATLSIGQRVVMHLYRYKHVDPADVYNIPWELTQDGIAAALRISRAHASIELKKLREHGKVEESLVHIKNGKTKRKAYTLTPLGLQDVPKIQEFAAKENIDIDALLDLKKQDPVILLNELEPEDRYALGCACAFRIPVPISMLPPTKSFTIPADLNSYSIISQQLRENILKNADPEEIVDWMLYASNKWLDDQKEHILGDEAEYANERLYNLVAAGVMTETYKHINKESQILVHYANDDIADLLDSLKDVPAKYEEMIFKVRVAVHMELKDYSLARSLLPKLKEYEPVKAEMYEADILYAEGNKEKAKEIISNISKDHSAAKTRLGRYLIDDGKLDEAEELLMSITVQNDDDSDIGIDKFIQLARIYHLRGDDAEAYHKLMKAKASFDSEGIKKKIGLIAKEYDIT